MNNQQYTVNFYKGKTGNAIKSGDTLIVKIRDAGYISGAIYKDNSPILPIWAMVNTVKIKLVKGRTILGRPKPLPKGTYVLKIRTASNGWDDRFEIE